MVEALLSSRIRVATVPLSFTVEKRIKRSMWATIGKGLDRMRARRIF